MRVEITLVLVVAGQYIYRAGMCRITSSSNTGQGAGTKFSEKSHFIVLRWLEGPRVGHLISLVGPMTAFISV